MTRLQRFIRKLRVDPDGCLIWIGARNSNGYANFWTGERYQTGHRFAYETFVGPIPTGLVLDHICRTPACVRPSHLEPVTQRTNLMRGKTVVAAHAAKTHCPRGHEYSRRHSGTSRVCLTCCREQDRLRRRNTNTTNNQENHDHR